jgi:hypothetical protein
MRLKKHARYLNEGGIRKRRDKYRYSSSKILPSCWINKTHMRADRGKDHKIKYFTKFILLTMKINKFWGQRSMPDTSMRATLEREELNTDIHNQRYCHHVE